MRQFVDEIEVDKVEEIEVEEMETVLASYVGVLLFRGKASPHTNVETS
jgi:hypothetical protein